MFFIGSSLVMSISCAFSIFLLLIYLKGDIPVSVLNILMKYSLDRHILAAIESVVRAVDMFFLMKDNAFFTRVSAVSCLSCAFSRNLARRICVSLATRCAC